MFNPLAGKSAAVANGSSSLAMDNVGVEIKNGLSKVTNFTSAGFAQFISGITDAKLTLSGPYDEGNMAFTVGGSVTITVFYTPVVTLAVPGLVESISPDIKVEDAERIKITVQSSGTFTAAIT